MASAVINRTDHPNGTRLLVARTSLLGAGAPDHDITIIAWHDDEESFTSRVNVPNGTVAVHKPEEYEIIYVLNADGSRSITVPGYTPTTVNPADYPAGTKVNARYEGLPDLTGIIIAWDGGGSVWILPCESLLPQARYVNQLIVTHTLVPTAEEVVRAFRFVREAATPPKQVDDSEVKDFLTLCREVKELGKKDNFNVSITLS